MSAQEPIIPPMPHEFTMRHERLSEHLERESLESTRSQGRKGNGGDGSFKAGLGLQNMARRTLGIFLLGVTVFLWTASNFLASVGVFPSPLPFLGL